jgi:acetyl esterase/lipase
MLGLDPAYLQAAGSNPSRLAGVIGLAGPYDFLPITDPEIKPIFPDADAATQPITYARAGAPPLLLLTGTDDKQVKPRNTKALAARTRELGGSAETRIYPGIGHIGLVTAIAPIFQWRAPVLHDVMGFIDAHASMRKAPALQPASQTISAVPKPPHPAT